MNLTIVGGKVRQDGAGLYSLNDLHKAAGAERKNEPSEWLSNKQTKELVSLLETTGIPVVNLKQGRNGGTWVCKELVYSYAMWVSPVFNIKVIRAFDALAQGDIENAKRIAARQEARLEAPHLTDAIKYSREIKGKEVAHYHFSNEFDLINRIALGRSAKEYRAAHGIGKDDPIRDHLTALEIRCVQAMQRANTTMIEMGMDYDTRKTELHKLYVRRHAPGLLEEVKRIEA